MRQPLINRRRLGFQQSWLVASAVGVMLLFLLNDTVLEIAPQTLATPTVAGHLARLTLTDAITLAREAFATEPELVRRAPVQAQRAALLMVLKQPEINAALFLPAAKHCQAQDVACRFASVATETMFEMKGLQDRGKLTPGLVNGYVWSRAVAA